MMAQFEYKIIMDDDDDDDDYNITNRRLLFNGFRFFEKNKNWQN